MIFPPLKATSKMAWISAAASRFDPGRGRQNSFTGLVLFSRRSCRPDSGTLIGRRRENKRCLAQSNSCRPRPGSNRPAATVIREGHASRSICLSVPCTASVSSPRRGDPSNIKHPSHPKRESSPRRRGSIFASVKKAWIPAIAGMTLGLMRSCSPKSAMRRNEFTPNGYKPAFAGMTLGLMRSCSPKSAMRRNESTPNGYKPAFEGMTPIVGMTHVCCEDAFSLRPLPRLPENQPVQQTIDQKIKGQRGDRQHGQSRKHHVNLHAGVGV